MLQVLAQDSEPNPTEPLPVSHASLEAFKMSRKPRSQVGKLRGPSAICVDAILETNLEAHQSGISGKTMSEV